MELLIFITLVIIVVLLAGIRSRQKSIADETKENISVLLKELQALKEAGITPVKKDLPLQATDEEVVQWRPYKAPETNHPRPAQTAANQEPPGPGKEKTSADLAALSSFMQDTRAKISREEPAPVPESWWDKWVRNNPDLEKFVVKTW